MKPRFKIVGNRPIEIVQVSPPESPLLKARRKYGRDFCTLAWKTGEGPRYWTAERVATLAAQNEERRMQRRNRK